MSGPFQHPPTPRRSPFPPDPPDPYAPIRKVLHAIAALGVAGSCVDNPSDSHRWFLIGAAIAACEVTAFALRPRESSIQPLDAPEVVGVRLGCAAVFGAVNLPLTAWIVGWTESPVGLALLALVGGAVCGGLAVRFGEDFWRWVRHPWNPF
jgi:hypothetical protein